MGEMPSAVRVLSEWVNVAASQHRGDSLRQDVAGLNVLRPHMKPRLSMQTGHRRGDRQESGPTAQPGGWMPTRARFQQRGYAP